MRPRTRFLLLCLAIVFGWYQWTSTITDRGQTTTERRIVTDEIALQERQESDEAEMYRTLQYLVKNKQNGLIKEVDAIDEIVFGQKQLAEGRFGGDDFVSFIQGSVDIIESEDGNDAYVILSDDFRAAKDAGLILLLSKVPNYREQSTHRLGPIISLTGRQIFKVPKDIVEEYSKSVLVWSTAFETLLSIADLQWENE